jgi:hypothetical protein
MSENNSDYCHIDCYINFNFKITNGVKKFTDNMISRVHVASNLGALPIFKIKTSRRQSKASGNTSRPSGASMSENNSDYCNTDCYINFKFKITDGVKKFTDNKISRVHIALHQTLGALPIFKIKTSRRHSQRQWCR